MKIEVCRSDDQILSCYQVMSQLRPGFTEEQFLECVKRLFTAQNYSLVSLTDNDEVRATLGIRIGESLAWGVYGYIDDLVTDTRERSSGYGKVLLDWAINYSRDLGCKELHLDSGVQRHDAHRFYLRERMDIVFYHFKLAI